MTYQAENSAMPGPSLPQGLVCSCCGAEFRSWDGCDSRHDDEHKRWHQNRYELGERRFRVKLEVDRWLYDDDGLAWLEDVLGIVPDPAAAGRT